MLAFWAVRHVHIFVAWRSSGLGMCLVYDHSLLILCSFFRYEQARIRACCVGMSRGLSCLAILVPHLRSLLVDCVERCERVVLARLAAFFSLRLSAM
jgi:hypothetical protein